MMLLLRPRASGLLAAALLAFCVGCGSDSGTKPDGDGNDGDDTTSPNVGITFPSNGETIDSTVTITAEANDPSGVREVSFRVSDYCDSLYFGFTDSISPYEADWTPDDALTGEFQLCVSATDSVGNTSNWACITVVHGESDVDISGFVPAGMHVGGGVTVYGSGFGPDDGTGKVTLCGKDAEVVSWSESAVTFIVPPGVTQDATSELKLIAGCHHVGKTYFDVTPPGVVRLTDDSANDGEPCWSFDGSRIYFSSMRTGNYDIWSVPVEGGDAVQFTYDPAADNWPDSNPNADVLAWGSMRRNGSHNPEDDYEIFTGTMSTLSQITSDDEIDRTPTWSPMNYMGYSMAYSDYIKDAYQTLLPRVMLYSQTDGHVRLIDGENPNFSPNGRMVVYSLEMNIYTITIGGSGTPVQLTNAGHDGAPHWGWANNKIVFERYGGVTGSDIYTMDPDGSHQSPLIATLSYEYNPTWSPDCKKVVYTGFRYSNLDIYVYEVSP